jgi:4'-phosphopantetheinyl transferase
MAIAWLTRSHIELPAGDDWLSPRERALLAGLRVAKRRADWRLGRYTVKAALGADVEILAAADGAPEAWRDGIRLPVSVSLSHREGIALVAVCPAPAVVGCDVERLEPRSSAFIGDWLAPAEQALVGHDDTLLPNLLWTAKEAAAKVRRQGLRLDVRAAVTRLEDREVAGWRGLAVEWMDGAPATRGWWRTADGFVMTVAATPGAPPPLNVG